MKLLLVTLALGWLNMHSFLHRFRSIQFKGRLTNICDHRSSLSYSRLQMRWNNTFFYYRLQLIYNDLTYTIGVKFLTKVKIRHLKVLIRKLGNIIFKYSRGSVVQKPGGGHLYLNNSSGKKKLTKLNTKKNLTTHPKKSSKTPTKLSVTS